MYIATFRLHTASLLQAMRSTGHAWSYKAWCSALISWFFFYFVRVKSFMNWLFDSLRVVIRVTINKLYVVPEWLVSGVVGMLWNGGGLGTGESDVSIVLLNSVLNRSSSLSDVQLAAFTGNPVNYTILFSWVDSVLWSY